MSAWKTVRLRRPRIEERNRTRTFERQLQRHVQKRAADHRDRKEFCFTSPPASRKPNDDDGREDRQHERRADEGEEPHDDGHRGGSKLVYCGSRCFVKLYRIAFEDLVREPTEEYERGNRGAQAEQKREAKKLNGAFLVCGS